MITKRTFGSAYNLSVSVSVSGCVNAPQALPLVNYIYFITTTIVSTFAAGLGEFKLRDLNDEINKLLREKRHWEDRIKELGGPDYKVGLMSL